STGAIWLGTENSGVQRWQEGKLTQFNPGEGGLSGSIYSLCLDQRGTVWAGNGEGSVFRYENGKFVTVWEYPEAGWNKRVYVIYEDRSGRVWFGTGLGIFCLENGGVRRFGGKDFDMGAVRTITEDARGQLWIGMSGGEKVRLARLEGEQFIACGLEEGIAESDVFALHAGADGSLWIGTAGKGLWRRR